MIEQVYNELKNAKTDVSDHFPIFRRYAEECESITELGVRWVVSTFAFLAAHPKRMVSIDIQDPHKWENNKLDLAFQMAAEVGCDYEFILADDLTVTPEQTDLLFIDSWHCYKQLTAELKLYSPKVNKYIFLHDTTLYEYTDESSYDCWGWKNEFTKKGLWPAVEEFLESNPEWILHERYFDHSGLTILKRK
jgi:cephalosporin hydroxylase